MSSVSPGAFVSTSDMYLPMPSWVMPRETVTPVFGTSENLIVSFGCAQMASDEVLADLVGGHVEGGGELDITDVIAAQVDVHEAGHEGVGRRVLVVLDALQQRVGAVADADDRDADLVVHAHLAVLLGHWFLSMLIEAVCQGLDDEVVGRPPTLAGAARELLHELARHAQQHVSGGARRDPAPAARLEGDGEAGGEDGDGDVVEARAPALDLVRQPAFEVCGHPDEDVATFPGHGQDDSSEVLSLCAKLGAHRRGCAAAR